MRAQKAPSPKNFPEKKINKATHPEARFIEKLLQRYPQYFDSLIQSNKWRISIVYTQINRTAANKPIFSDYYYNTSGDLYFYPASTVKMPTAVLALQKLHELHLKSLDRNTTMITDSAYLGQTYQYNDPESEDGRPTISNYIKKIFLVSDNNAFNRLYEFLGPAYINAALRKMGFKSTEIIHRLNIPLTPDQNRYANPVYFFDSAGKIIFTKPLTQTKLPSTYRKNLLGKGYYIENQLIEKPFDFSQKNKISLPDLHTILKTILFPESVGRGQRFHLTKDDYSFLYQYMSMKPGESVFPQYDSSYTDSYSKFLLYGGKGPMLGGIRIFNKEGDAYGFLTDIAYIVDFKKNVEFLLSATILCNSDEIFNDDRYDYENVGYPFLKNLGKVFYDFECDRAKRHTADLSKFRFSYQPGSY
ncbi:MAG: hypothetical protein NVS1B13_09580 [Flavisolibacter sp.]